MRFINILDCAGNITSCCNDYGLARIMGVIKKSFIFIQLAAPIILILMVVAQLTKMVVNPDDKKDMKRLMNKFIAAVIIFIVPVFVNVVLRMLPEQIEITACWNASDDVNKIIAATKTKYYSVNDKKAKDILTSPEDYKKGKDKKSSSGSLKKATYLKGGMPIPIYYQGDYADVSLMPGTDRNVASSGCGFTSCSMIVSYLLDKKITPREFVGGWSRKYYVYSAGMSWELPQAAATHYNLGTVEQSLSPDRMVQALKNNQPVMSSQSSGLFTSGGHLIVLRGVTSNGKILVNDPNKGNAVDRGYNNRAFTVQEINAANRMYFIFPKKK